MNEPRAHAPQESQHNYPNLVPDGTGNIVETRKRGESLDIFLSRSPSQSLGTEFLKFRNEENMDAIPALSLEGGHGSSYDMNNSSMHAQTHMHHQSIASGSAGSTGSVGDNNLNVRGGVQGNMSPPVSVTGTSASSRSASPSWNSGDRRNGGQTILAYNQQQPPSNNDYHDSMGFQSRGRISAHSSNVSAGLSHPVQSSNYAQNLETYGQHRDNSMMLQPQQHQVPQQMNQGYIVQGGDNMASQQGGALLNDAKPQQGQVFYMAVPTQDGQGQVLQPIQMVQLPGQPNAFVLPSASGTAPMQFQQMGMGGVPQNSYMSSQGGYDTHDQHSAKQQSQQQFYSGGNSSIQGSQRMKSFNPMQNNSRASSRDAGYGGTQSPYQYEESYGQTSGDSQFGDSREPIRKDMLTNNEIVANLYASPKRPPLRELLGHVRRLSRDQVGCRLLQQALDEEGDTAATAILKEGLTFWGEAMVDPFGNYLFQKILEKITPEERVLMIKTVSTRLVNASLNLHGTRSVQKVVELCAIDEVNESEDESSEEQPEEVEKDSKKSKKGKSKKKETAAEILTKALTPAAARLCIDSHGNHVIQRILLKLPYKYSQFVFEAVANSVGDVARHRHGCCVIQRCLDSPPSNARSNLVSKIVEKSLELMQDAYGNYVVQYVLDVCSDDDVHAVCESVAGKVSLLAIQKFSSNVMEKCLERCTDKVREAYLEELSDQERIRELMMDPFGNYVIQRALAVASHTQALKLVDAMRPHLMSSTGGGIRNTAGGRRILAKIERRFPHFNINEEGSIERAIHRKGGMPHEMSNPMMAPQQHRGPRRGPKKMGGKEMPPPQYHQPRYREYPQDHGSHQFDPNYYMMGANHRSYDHM